VTRPGCYCSPPRIRQLTSEGVLDRAAGKDGKPLRGRYVLLALVNRYVSYQRKLIMGRRSLNGADEYTVARTRRMNATATLEELKLKRLSGQLHHAEDVEFLLTSMITAARARLLSLPARCCHLLQGKTSLNEATQILTGEVEHALRELSEYDPKALAAANEQYLSQVGVARPEGQANGNGDSASLSGEPEAES
jgi:phage terminase Nu1 subunit (DNA packaging protein)